VVGFTNAQKEFNLPFVR